jgi:HlyD family secretion protein
MTGFFAGLMSLLAFVPGMGQQPTPNWNGYVEDDYLYAAAASAGQIAAIPVREGQLVKKGDVLFVLESSQQQAQYDAAKAQADAAQASLANLQTGGRPEELDVARAALQKALSDLDLAQQNLTRTKSLFAQGLVTQAQLDQATAAVQAAQAAVNQAQAQVKVAELPARDAQQIAAQATLDAAKATADAAKATLELRRVTAQREACCDKRSSCTGAERSSSASNAPMVRQASKMGSAFRSRSGSNRSSSSAPRGGSAASSRTAPWPAQ